MWKRTKPKRVRNITEIGFRDPKELIRRASLDSAWGRPKQYTGIEMKDFNVRKALEILGERELPENIKLLRGDAGVELEKMPDNSQDLILATYALNNTGLQKLNHVFVHVLLSTAKDKLRPGGRILLVQDKNDLEALQRFAAHLGGLEFFAKEIPQGIALNSPSPEIRDRATKRLRIRYAKKQAKENKSKRTVTASKLTPYIISLRKPKQKRGVIAFFRNLFSAT